MDENALKNKPQPPHNTKAETQHLVYIEQDAGIL